MAQKMKLYERQNTLGENASSLFAKLEIGEVRAASLKSLEEQLSNIELEFKSNDSKLRQLGITTEDYFQNEYFKKVLMVIDEARVLIKNRVSTNQPAKDTTLRADVLQVKESVPQIKESIPEDQMQTLRNEMQQMFKNLLTEIKSGGNQHLGVQQIAPSEQEKIPQMAEIMSQKLRGDMEQEKRTSAMLIQYRREIRKLEDSLEDGYENDNIIVLEHIKYSWEKMMSEIKQIYRELSMNYLVNEDIDEEFDAIEKQYLEALSTMLRWMTVKKESNAVILEKIKIPYFNGAVEEWTSFHDLFKRLIHENTNMSAVEKLVRLKSHVKGEAFKVIQSLPVTDCNYVAAWEMLCNRFGNKRILFTKLIDNILDQPTANSMSAGSLKNLLDKTNESIQALKSLGYKLEDADPILARIIIRKLDREGLLLYEQNTRKSKEVQILDDIMQFLEMQYQALDAATTKKSYSYKNQLQQRPTALFSEQPLCLFCSKNGHKVKECTKLLALPVEGRLKWARGAKICCICLNHRMDKRCFSKSKCDECGKKHNTIMHLLSEEDSFVTRFTNSSPPSQFLQNPKQLEEKYKEKFVPALTPPLNLLKKIPVTVKSKDSLPESTSKEAMKENRVENKTELFGMQELDDQFIKSVEVSGLNLQTTSTETTPKEVDSMSKTEKIPRERPEWQGEEGRPLPGPGRGAGFVAVSKRASVVSMVGKIPPLPQQLEERPQSEPDWDAEEGQIDTPKNSEGTPKRECMEHDQRELPIPNEKSGSSARLWSTEWHKGDDGSGKSVGYQRGPPGSITHHLPALMNFPVKPPCSFHEGPIPPLFLNKKNMTYTDPNILKKQQAAQASAFTTANQKWHPYRIILDIGISGKDDSKRLLSEVKQQIGEELKAEAIKTDTKDDIKADIKDDVSSLSTLDEDSQNPIETNDIKPKDEVEDTTDIKPSIEDTPTDAINVDSLQALACMQVYQCKFEMEMLFLQENKLNLQKYAKNSQTNKSFFVTAATPSKLSSTIGILPALPTSFLKSPKPPPEVSNNIVDANREAIKMTISPMKLLSKPAIFNTSLSEELDRRIKGVDGKDEIEFTEKLVKPAKEVAIVKPMMETQLSDSQHQHCTPKI